MDTKEHLTQTLEHFRQQRAAKFQEVRSLEVIIRGLELELGEAPPTQPMPDPPAGSESLAQTIVNGTSPQLRADEFFSMTQTDAARAYLKKVGSAISLDQLLDGLKRGGAHVGGADPKYTLYVSLMRNPRREFIKVRDGLIGLRDFYPNLPKVVKNGVRKPRRGRRKILNTHSTGRSARQAKLEARRVEGARLAGSERAAPLSEDRSDRSGVKAE